MPNSRPIISAYLRYRASRSSADCQRNAELNAATASAVAVNPLREASADRFEPLLVDGRFQPRERRRSPLSVLFIRRSLARLSIRPITLDTVRHETRFFWGRGVSLDVIRKSDSHTTNARTPARISVIKGAFANGCLRDIVSRAVCPYIGKT
jgi:hypothetical protein